MIRRRLYRPALAAVLIVTTLLAATLLEAQTAPDDLLATAQQRTAQASAYDFEFDLELALTATQGTETALDFQGEGTYDQTRDEPAVAVSLNGDLTVGGRTTPTQFDARVVGGIVYFSFPDRRGWTGTPVSELVPLLQDMVVTSFRNGFRGQTEPPGSTGALVSGSLDDPAVRESLTAIELAVANLNLGDFASVERLDDVVVDGERMAHYRTRVEIDDVMRSPEAMNLLVALLQLGDPSLPSTFTAAEMNTVAALVRRMLQDTTISLEHYVSLDDPYVRRAILDVGVPLDPTPAASDDGARFELALDVRLKAFDSGQSVGVPEHALVINNLANALGLTSRTVASSLPSNNPDPVDLRIPPQQQPTATPAAAQTLPIAPNTPTVINLSSRGPTDLIYEGQQNETISVVAHSLEEPGTVDTTVEVLTESGTRLSFNDDHTGTRTGLHSFDSVIEDLRLPGPGRYIIRVTSFTGAAEGRVEVTVESANRPLPQINSTPTANVTPVIGTPGPPAGTPTAPTMRINAVVPPGESYVQTFQGSAGQIVTITVRATAGSDLDPKVRLLGPNGNALAENDDHASNDPTLGNFDSRIANFQLPTPGAYVAEITGFAQTGGPFELVIEFSGGGSGTVIPPQDAQSVDGRVGTGQIFTYPFQANAGDVYTFTVTGIAGFDPQLTIFSPNDDVLAFNDDHGTSDRTLSQYDSRIENVILVETGEYTIQVNGYQQSGGQFTLTYERVDTGAPTQASEPEVIVGSIQPNGLYTTTITLEAGDYVSIAVRSLSSTMDPRVALVDPSGQIVAENDDNDRSDQTMGPYDSLLRNVQVEQSGIYTIEVRGYRDSSGSFAIVVTRFE